MAMAEEAAAAKAAAAAAEPAKKSTRTLTDKDFARPPAPPAAPKDDAGDASKDAGAAKPAKNDSPNFHPNSLKVLDSHERIQGNPSFSNPS